MWVSAWRLWNLKLFWLCTRSSPVSCPIFSWHSATCETQMFIIVDRASGEIRAGDLKRAYQGGTESFAVWTVWYRQFWMGKKECGNSLRLPCRNRTKVVKIDTVLNRPYLIPKRPQIHSLWYHTYHYSGYMVKKEIRHMLSVSDPGQLTPQSTQATTLLVFFGWAFPARLLYVSYAYADVIHLGRAFVPPVQRSTRKSKKLIATSYPESSGSLASG